MSRSPLPRHYLLLGVELDAVDDRVSVPGIGTLVAWFAIVAWHLGTADAVVPKVILAVERQLFVHHVSLKDALDGAHELGQHVGVHNRHQEETGTQYLRAMRVLMLHSWKGAASGAGTHAES